MADPAAALLHHLRRRDVAARDAGRRRGAVAVVVAALPVRVAPGRIKASRMRGRGRAGGQEAGENRQEEPGGGRARTRMRPSQEAGVGPSAVTFGRRSCAIIGRGVNGVGRGPERAHAAADAAVFRLRARRGSGRSERREGREGPRGSPHRRVRPPRPPGEAAGWRCRGRSLGRRRVGARRRPGECACVSSTASRLRSSPTAASRPESGAQATTAHRRGRDRV